ncbi:MAG: sigma-70 family RNA polymerase sigma factor [Clostridia bacterium]|nr:sigma-70 family RNA polymerase sigma factor [Clostridia bacterium]
MQDNEIIALYFARDEAAIRETQRAYGALCLSLAMRILNDRSDSEECVNDTWLGVWNSIPPQRPQSLRAYVCKLTRRIAINRWQYNHAGKRNADVTVPLEELAECMPDTSADDPALAALIKDFVVGLEPDDRKLFVGRYWHGYAVSAMAKAYGLTQNAVSLRLRRIRERLQTYLNERGYRV